MDGIVVLTGAAGLAALVWKAVDFIRLVSNIKTEMSAIVTQILAWLMGIITVLAYASSDFATSVTIGEQSLDSMNFWSLMLIGIAIASLGSAAVDFKQARDTNDSSAKPRLLD